MNKKLYKMENINNELSTSAIEVVKILTDTQKEVLEKFRREGKKNLTRNDYQQLSTIKKNCKQVIENYDEAIKVYLELTS